jgi:carbamoyltransferase
VDGKIHTIIEEERLTRVKSGDNFYSYPDLSSLKIEEVTGIKISDCDYRIVVSPSPDAYFRKLLKNSFEKCSHHDAHNYGAYFTSGFEGKVLSISYDGGGENSVLKVFLCEDGKMVQVLDGKMHTYASLGHLWGMSTYLMLYGQEEIGMWSMCKDEGKLVGMAAEGRYDEDIYKILQSLISYDNLSFAGGPTNWRARFVIREMAKLGYFNCQEKREIFSYNLQKFTEDLFINFLNDLHNLYPEYSKICFSGGLFANVKLNKKINELDWVKEIFIYPAMGDEGLPLGGALKKAFELGEIHKPEKLQNVFFGLEYTEHEIEKISKEYEFERYNYNVDDIANKINDGKIIGWFKGRFE